MHFEYNSESETQRVATMTKTTGETEGQKRETRKKTITTITLDEENINNYLITTSVRVLTTLLLYKST